MMCYRFIFVALMVWAGVARVGAYDFSANGVYFNVTSAGMGTCEVTYSSLGSNAYSGEVVVPARVSAGDKEYVVTAVGKDAFSYCSQLEVVVIPNTVTAIKEGAFYGCGKLRKVALPGSVSQIKERAFGGCPGLQAVCMGDGLDKKTLKKLYPQWGSNVSFEVDKRMSELMAEGLVYTAEAKSEKPGAMHSSQYLSENKLAPANNASANVAKAKAQLRQQTVVAVQSDVDKVAQTVAGANDKTFAIVIGNENYQEVGAVPFANHDGEVFAMYCQKVLGMPETNVHLVKDATLNNIRRELNWIRQVSEAYGGEMRLVFYYAGHGIPDEQTHSAYLLPVDGYGTDVKTGYALSELYKELGALQAERIVVLLDACFSGAARDGGMVVAARGVALKAKKEQASGNMLIISAAQNDETAYPFEKQGHGMFTYYLLKKLQETKGAATLGELQEYITENVKKQSVVVNGKMQTPSASASLNVSEMWREWTLK